MFISVPATFEGSESEQHANYDSHIWADGRCMNCDCNGWGIACSWPCGAEIPRVIIEFKFKSEANSNLVFPPNSPPNSPPN